MLVLSKMDFSFSSKTQLMLSCKATPKNYALGKILRKKKMNALLSLG